MKVRRLASVATVLLATGAAWRPADAQAPTSTAAEAAEAPAAPPPSLPGTGPAGLKTLTDAVAPSPQERAVLEAVRDRVSQLDETGLYVILGMAARAPSLAPAQWDDELDRPAYGNLIREPARYRGRPMQARLRAYHVWRLMPGAGLSFSQFWPDGRAVWQMDCIWSDAARQWDKPLRVYSLADPSAVLGPSDDVGRDGRVRYKEGPELRAAGLFYKVYRDSDADGRPRDYPVVIAWQVQSPGPGAGPAPSSGLGGLRNLGPLLMLVIGLGVLFALARRRLAKLKEADAAGPPPGQRWRARFRQAGDSVPGTRPTASSPGDAGQVDPELAAAAEDFLRRKEQADSPPARTGERGGKAPDQSAPGR